MQLPELLATLGSTHHAGRIRVILELAKRSKAEPELAALLESLRSKGPYLRQLALYADVSLRNGEAVAKAAASEPFAKLRRHALRAAAAVCEPEPLLTLLDDLPPTPRRQLLLHLRRRHRVSVIDAWLERQAEPQVEWLAFASTALLNRHEARFAERADRTDWSRVARQNPDWAAERVLSGPADERQLGRLQAVLQRLVELRDRRALPLWWAALEAGHPAPSLPEAGLFGCAPEAAARRALTRPENPGWPFAYWGHRYSFEVCQQLLHRGWLPLEWRWWSRRPPAERAEIWVEARGEAIAESGRIPLRWLERLPRGPREEEARRQGNLPELQLDPTQLALYIGLLPFEEGLRELQPWLGNPEVSWRAAGAAGTVRLARYHPDRLNEILQLLVQRKNEADPVRTAFLTELANLPPSRWQATHFKPLSEILKALMSAGDASSASYAAAERLVLRILARQPAWAAAWQSKLLHHHGRSTLSSWDVYLQGADDLGALENELVPVLERWVQTERFSSFFGVVRALGRHLRRCVRLQALTAQVCQHPQADPARAALRSLLKAVPGEAGRLVPQLVTQDPSWIEEPMVLRTLHRHRQDLLEPYLAGGVMHGKFASGQTRWVLSFGRGFWRWTPDQQARFHDQLAGLLNSDRDLPSLFGCLRQLEKLALVPPRALKQHAALAEQREAVRETALRCLGRLDGGQGVGTLLEALQDERARIAIYALRHALLAMPPSQALETLLAVDSPKITVQKEVARLLGDLPEALGLPALLQRLAGELQRDVRIACLRGLWDHLDRDEVWPWLERAAQSDDEAVVRALAVIPAARHGEQARARLANLLVALLQHPSLRVRAAVLQRLSASPVADPEGRIRAAAEPLLKSRGTEASHAATVLFELLRQKPQEWATLLRDQRSCLPALQHLCDALNLRFRWRRRELDELLSATLTVLREDPVTLLPALRLIASCQRLPELLQAVEQEVLSDPSAWDIPLNWPELLRQHAFRLNDSLWSEIWERWGRQVDPRLRRLALEALLIHTRDFGWKAEPRAQLEEFQGDNTALVRARALFVVPPPEEGKLRTN